MNKREYLKKNLLRKLVSVEVLSDFLYKKKILKYTNKSKILLKVQSAIDDINLSA